MADEFLSQLIAQEKARLAGMETSGEPVGRPLQISLGRRPSTVRVAAGVAGASGLPHRPTSFTRPSSATFNSIDEARSSWYLLDDEYRDQVMEDMFSFGLIDGAAREDQAAGVWETAVGFAWNYAQVGKDVKPTDMFARMTTLKAGEQGPNGVRTNTSRSYRYLDPMNAEALVRSAWRQAVGRDATPSELRQLAGSIISQSKANPTVTTVTTDRDGNQTSTTEGGFDAQAAVANQLDANPEAKAYQAAADLFPALQEALNAPI